MLQILFVEDDERIRDCLAGYLRLKGHRVLEAANGEQAVTLARKATFDLIMMDVKMPKLDGVSACAQIRAFCPSTKVVLMTGFHMTPELERVVQSGEVECLQKPLLMKDLDALLSRAQGDRKQADAASAPDAGASAKKAKG
ncbi:MAG: response regulator [Candidatus Omnitrophica bacterium]|nr:response regulator [Candidatus Omnitrophota bacterium]